MNKTEFRKFLDECSRQPTTEHLTTKDGDSLMVFQATCNNGRGSTVARSIAKALQRGHNVDAGTEFYTDKDKVRQYPELLQYLNTLFKTNYV